MVKLSICIPTFNMSPFLEECIESIVINTSKEKLPFIEVCISDNASTDNTQEMINKYKNSEFNFIYHKNNENIGPEANFLQAIELASGEYCILLGADDAINESTINNLLNEINNDSIDIFLFNRFECNSNLNPISEKKWLYSSIKSRAFDFSKQVDLINYLNNTTSLGAIFSYMSSMAFKKSKWDQYTNTKPYLKSSYMHVYKLLSIINDGGILKYIKRPLVKCRLENDSFHETNYKRLMIDFNGYLLLISTIINKENQKYYYKSLHKEHPWYKLIRISSLAETQEELDNAKSVLSKCYYNPLTINICFKIGKLKFLVNWLVIIKKKLLN